MGKFKDYDIIENQDSLTRIFKSKNELPSQIKSYLRNQGYYLLGNSYTLSEERQMTTHNLFFMGNLKYSKPKLIYTIKDNENDCTMIMETDSNYSYFQMLLNTFLDEEYF